MIKNLVISIMLLSVCSMAGAQDMSQCLSVVERNGFCDLAPGTLGLEVTNNCDKPIVAKWCFKTVNGTKCDKELISARDTGYELHSCKPVNGYEITACLQGSVCEPKKKEPAKKEEKLEPTDVIACPGKGGKAGLKVIPYNLRIRAPGVFNVKTLRKEGDQYKIVSKGNVVTNKKSESKPPQTQLFEYFCGKQAESSVVLSITGKLREIIIRESKKKWKECVKQHDVEICILKIHGGKDRAAASGPRD